MTIKGNKKVNDLGKVERVRKDKRNEKKMKFVSEMLKSCISKMCYIPGMTVLLFMRMKI